MKIIKPAISLYFSVLLSGTSYAKGWVDAANYNRYTGWACKSGSSQIVDVHIYANNKLIGAGKAGNIREAAVRDACGSTSVLHGFDVQVSNSPDMLDGSMKDVVIYTIYNDGSHEKIDNTPIKVLFPAAPGSSPQPIEPGDVVGRDLNSAGAGFMGHIGIWDGRMVIEALGTQNSNDTLKRNSWSSFIQYPNQWRTISPITINFNQKYCDGKDCSLTELENGDLVTMIGPTSGIRKMAAASAYAKFLIGASYTLTANYSSSRQGVKYYTKRHCSPFAANCQPRQVEVKPVRGLYRCDTFVLDAWGGTSPAYANALVGARNSGFVNQNDVQKWDKQIQFLTSPLRIRTPKDAYDNLQRSWW